MQRLNYFLTIGATLFMITVTATDVTAQEGQSTTTIVNPSSLYDPAPYGYSHAVVANGYKRIAYIAGQGGENKMGKLNPEFAKQVEQAYKNLLVVLEGVNAKPSQVSKLTTYVVNYDQSMLAVMTQHVRKTFGDALPAQTLVPVPRLALDGMLFEVDAIAVLD